MQELTYAMMSEHVGSRFRLSAEGLDPFEVELIEVNDLSRKDPNRDDRFRKDPFSLVFRADDCSLFPQRIYKLEHDQLGELEMFLVPIGPAKDDAGLCFEAIFN